MVSESAGGGSSGRLKDLRILIAEDKFLVAEGLKLVVKTAGADVLGTVATVDGGLDYVTTEPIDVALVDMDLRGEFADRLIVGLIERSIPFIIVTGYQVLPLDYEADAIAVLHKPVDKEELVDLLSTIPRRS